MLPVFQALSPSGDRGSHKEYAAFEQSNQSLDWFARSGGDGQESWGLIRGQENLGCLPPYLAPIDMGRFPSFLRQTKNCFAVYALTGQAYHTPKPPSTGAFFVKRLVKYRGL